MYQALEFSAYFVTTPTCLFPNIPRNSPALIYQSSMMVATNNTLEMEFGASKVSGFYGPGSLIAWWMQCASFALDVCLKPQSTPPQHLSRVSQRIRFLTGQLFWSCLSLSVVAGFAYIAQRDLKEAAHDKRSTASFHAPVAVLLQYNLITFIFLALRLGKWFHDISEAYYRGIIHRRDSNNGNTQDGRVSAIKLRAYMKLLSFGSAVVILFPSVLLNDTKTLVYNTLRDCSALEDPSANSSLTCLENYAIFLDTYVPGKAGSTEYLTAKTYPVPRSVNILTFIVTFFGLISEAIHYTSSYRASWRDRPGWRGRFAAVDSAISAMEGRVDKFSTIFFFVRYSGVIIAPDAIMWIAHGRIRGLMPLTTTSLSDQDQLAAVALGGLAFISSQKDLILRSLGLIEKVFFGVFSCNPVLQESVVELEHMGNLDNVMSQPHQDGRGATRERRPKT